MEKKTVWILAGCGVVAGAAIAGGAYAYHKKYKGSYESMIDEKDMPAFLAGLESRPTLNLGRSTQLLRMYRNHDDFLKNAAGTRVAMIDDVTNNFSVRDVATGALLWVSSQDGSDRVVELSPTQLAVYSPWSSQTPKQLLAKGEGFYALRLSDDGSLQILGKDGAIITTVFNAAANAPSMQQVQHKVSTVNPVAPSTSPAARFFRSSPTFKTVANKTS